MIVESRGPTEELEKLSWYSGRVLRSVHCKSTGAPKYAWSHESPTDPFHEWEEVETEAD